MRRCDNCLNYDSFDFYDDYDLNHKNQKNHSSDVIKDFQDFFGWLKILPEAKLFFLKKRISRRCSQIEYADLR